MPLKRSAITELIRWKDSAERKPMVLKGARQVGKTWLSQKRSCCKIEKRPNRTLSLRTSPQTGVAMTAFLAF